MFQKVGVPGKAYTVGRVLLLAAVFAAAAYFRLWNIEHTFNLIHDFDEGVYALGSRAILEGNLPYRDFILIHPPLYNLVLAGGYGLFGYDFMLGRYLSVALSLAGVALVYVVARQLYGNTAGIVSAAFFGCSGLVVYLGRRGVQDTLGLVPLLLGLLLAARYPESREKKHLLLACVAFGVALATKYLFLPAVAGILIATLVCVAPDRVWQGVRKLADLRFWALYAGVSVSLYAVVLLLSRLGVTEAAIPLLEPLYPGPVNVLVVTALFVLPVPAALAMTGKLHRLHLAGERLSWPLPLRDTVLALGGLVAGFLLVVGPLFVQAPAEYLRQTVFLHQQRTVAEIPSLVGVIRVLPINDVSLTLVALPVLCTIPILFLLPHRRDFSRADAFIVVALAVAFLMCQVFPPMPRYYICIYPLVFLGIARLVSGLGTRPEGLTWYVTHGAMVALFIASLLSTVLVISRYSPDSDLRNGRLYTPDEYAYTQVAASLETMGAQKVYAVNPAFVAMARDLQSSSRVDTFAELFLESRPADELLDDLAVEGVDYVVLDPWLTYWGDSWPETRLFAEAVRSNSRLVDTVEYGLTDHVEIYELGAEPEPLFNGDLTLWDRYAGLDYPAGWQPVLIDGRGDSAEIEHRYYEGKDCVALTVFEDGEAEEENSGTHTALTQMMPFPEGWLFLELQCSSATDAVGSYQRGPAIHFLDGEGHSLIVGFSDTIEEQELYPCEECDKMLVLEPCQLYQWDVHGLNLQYLWGESGWPQPDTLRVLVTVSTDDDHAGYHELLMAAFVLP